MLSDEIRILDLDGSVTCQEPVVTAAAHVIDARSLGEQVRFMAQRRHMREFSRSLSRANRDCLTFIGSGDYHHITAALVAQWQRLLSVVVFDNHPDWDITSPWRCCGSWVNTVLGMPNVRKVVIIGPGRPDLHGWHLLRGNQAALRSGRLEVFPASWPSSKTLDRKGAATLEWQTVSQTGLQSLIETVIGRLPTRDVYLSVDKDCLTADYAVTNWEEGELTLAPLLQAVERLCEATNLIGADITGEYSTGAIRNPLFRLISGLNHPPSNHGFAPGLKPDLTVNEVTNLALIRAFQLH